MTLPRLGSRVRIPSPAPDFLKKISGLERSFGAAFCFPGLWAGVGEALGKQPAAGCGGRWDAVARRELPDWAIHITFFALPRPEFHPWSVVPQQVSDAKPTQLRASPTDGRICRANPRRAWTGIAFCSCMRSLGMFNMVWHGLVAMKQPAAQPNHLTIADAASLLGVSISTLRNWDRQGKLSPRRHPINGYRMYDRAEIERLKELIEGRV